MNYAVVTTFSPKGYEVYGRRFIESFARYWPDDVRLYAYYEGAVPPSDASPRAIWLSLEHDKDRAAFMARYKDTEQHDYRKCAVRYSHKVWAITSAPRDVENLIWLDGDCETFAQVAPWMIQNACAEPGQVGSFLGRPYHRHTETGFWSVRMKNCGADFLDEMRRMYTSGDVYNLSEWHDCMVFDFVRRKLERAGYRFRNICPDAKGLSVFEYSPLNGFIRHNKGPERKGAAYGDRMTEQAA